MASIFKRGKNYYINIVVDGIRIKRKIGPSKKIAELALKDYEVKVARQEFDFTIADILLDDLFTKFIEYSETNHAFSTTKRYKNVMMNLRIFLGIHFKNVKRVSHLNAQIIEKYKHFRRTTDPRTINLPKNFPYSIKNNSLKAKTKTLNYEIKTLRSIFQYGIRNKLCKDNPCESVILLKVTDASTPRFLTFDESELFLNACGDLYPIFYTFLNTGVRLGELLHLQWNDIDFKRRKMIVQAKEFWKPKSGFREIPLNDGLLKLLKKVIPKDYDIEDFVFPGKKGGIIKRKLRLDLVRIADGAGIKHFTKIHSLRHTFASHLVMKGVDIPTVQKLLGHSDIQTTMIYSHLSPDHLVDAVNKLNGKPGDKFS